MSHCLCVELLSGKLQLLQSCFQCYLQDSLPERDDATHSTLEDGCIDPLPHSGFQFFFRVETEGSAVCVGLCLFSGFLCSLLHRWKQPWSHSATANSKEMRRWWQFGKEKTHTVIRQALLNVAFPHNNANNGTETAFNPYNEHVLLLKLNYFGNDRPHVPFCTCAFEPIWIVYTVSRVV